MTCCLRVKVKVARLAGWLARMLALEVCGSGRYPAPLPSPPVPKPATLNPPLPVPPIPLPPCTPSSQGTWGCSISGNCDLIITNDSAASLIVMLRLLRIFRILWIFKNFNVLSISTVLGKIQVRSSATGASNAIGASARGRGYGARFALCRTHTGAHRRLPWLPLCQWPPNAHPTTYPTRLPRLPPQDEFYAARWVVSLLELLIVLVYLGHLSGCFFYLFSGPRWYTNGACAPAGRPRGGSVPELGPAVNRVRCCRDGR